MIASGGIRTSVKKKFDINTSKTNTHIHTPFSYSTFDNIEDIFFMSDTENIVVAGINDFFTFDGYDQFNQNALRHKIYPIFGIEFIGIDPERMNDLELINDPANPGRIYFCGKGIKYPLQHISSIDSVMSWLQESSNRHSARMIMKLNEHLTSVGLDLKLSFEEVQTQYTLSIVRDRHIAMAIRFLLYKHCSSEAEIQATFKKITGGKMLTSQLTDKAGVENEIRESILKKGGAAYIEENSGAFPAIQDILQIIRAIGGIPCYPVLLDHKNGQFTDFEKDWESLDKNLTAWNVSCIELIPVRNDVNVLARFVKFFHERDYIITFGTEHNTPQMIPLTTKAKGNTSLPEELVRISNEGCAILAAHQHRLSKGELGFVTPDGRCKKDEYQNFVKEGIGVINSFLQQ